MTLSSANKRELYELLAAMRDDRLTPWQVERLEELVLGDPAARRLYLDYVDLCVGLQWSRAKKSLRLPWAAAPGGLWSSLVDYLSNPAAVPILVATLFMVGLLGLLAIWAAPLPRQVAIRLGFSAPPVYVARVTGQRDCVWRDDAVAPLLGSHLALGRTLDLVSGLVEITFDRGARVVVEGPATLDIASADGLSMSLGQLRAHVPERAVGFQVMTPTVKVTDLGTEFGLRVDLGGQSEVHVFIGRVQADSVESGDRSPGPPLQLGPDEAARFYPGWMPPSRIAFDRQAFARLAHLSPPSTAEDAFDLGQIPDLVLWLDAGRGVTQSGGAVSAWADQSGNGRVFTQSDSDRMPCMATDAVSGLPVLSFQSGTSGDYLLLPASSSNHLQLDTTFTAFFVVSPDVLPNDDSQRFFGHYNAGQFRFNEGKANTWSGVNGTLESPAPDLGRLQIIVYLFDTNVKIGLNGIPTAQVLASATISSSNLNVGGHTNDYGRFDGDIAEIIIYDRPLTEVEIKKVGQYLSDKYRLGLAVWR